MGCYNARSVWYFEANTSKTCFVYIRDLLYIDEKEYNRRPLSLYAEYVNIVETYCCVHDIFLCCSLGLESLGSLSRNNQKQK